MSAEARTLAAAGASVHGLCTGLRRGSATAAALWRWRLWRGARDGDAAPGSRSTSATATSGSTDGARNQINILRRRTSTSTSTDAGAGAAGDRAPARREGREGRVSKVIRNGTIVTADRTWKADVLVEGETIKAIGEGLKGDEEIDATDAYVIPGGIDPHTHLEMPFMGTTAAETFESGHLRGGVGRDDDARRLRAAGAGREPARPRSTSGTGSRRRRSASTSATTWRSPAGTRRSGARWTRW